jgi:competence protein ComEC
MFNAGVWHTVPMVRFLIPFLLGCGISMFYSIPHIWVWTSIIIGALVCGIMVWSRSVYIGIVANILLFLSGIALHQWQDVRMHKQWFNHHDFDFVVAEITEPAVEKKRSWKLVTKITHGGFRNQSEVVPTTGKLLIYVGKNDSLSCTLQYGNKLIISSSYIKEIAPPKNPGEFNYKRYLAFRHIHHQAYLKPVNIYQLKERGGFVFFKLIYSLQAYFQQVLAEYIGTGSERGIAQALLYGNDDALDAETVQAFAHTGTLHVLAVSGMHVGIIFMLLSKLLFWMDKWPRFKILKVSLLIGSLWFYAALCSTSPSILRASVMFSFIIISQAMGRNSSIYNTLAASAFLLMIFDINIISNVGFQLSYLAVIGIVFLQPLIYNWFTFHSKYIDLVWKISAVSIAAQVATSPIGLLYFHQFPNCFLFSNLFIIPLTTVILHGCILLVISSPFQALSQLVGWILKSVIALTNWLVKLVEQLPYAYIEGIQVSIAQTILLYCILAAAISYLLFYQKGLVFVFLILVGSYITMHQYQIMNNINQVELTVYHVPRHTATSVLMNGVEILIADSALLADDEKLRFHMRQHRWSRGIKHTQYITDIEKPLLMNVGNKQILISGKLPSLASPATHPIDYLVVNHPINPAKLAHLQPANVIIASNVSVKKSKELEMHFKNKDIPVFNVRDSIAFNRIIAY